MPSTFERLVADLARDHQRAQPKDALQWSADWFQRRLDEQRTRLRAVVANSAHAASLPQDLYEDNVNASLGPSFPASLVASSSPRPSFSDPFKNPFGGPQTLPSNPKGGPGGPFFTINEDEALSPTAFSNPFSGGAPNLAIDSSLGPPPSSLGRRTSVSAESIIPNSNSTTPLPYHPKTPQKLERIKVAIKNNFIFRDVEEKQLQTVLGAMEEYVVEPGTVVIRQGDHGDYFYVVEDGTLLCYIQDTAGQQPISPFSFGEGPLQGAVVDHNPSTLMQSSSHPVYGTKVAENGPGTSFGELALMYGHPRAATVLAITKATLWRLDRMTFRTIILKAAHLRRTMYEDFLKEVPLLSSLSAEERSKIADAVVSLTFDDGREVIKEGEMGDTFFFIEEGEAVVSKRRKEGEGEEELSTLKKGDYFGELSLLRLEPRAATVRAKIRTNPSQPKLKVAQMTAAAFTRLLGPMRDIMERKAEVYNVVSPTSGGRSAA